MRPRRAVTLAFLLVVLSVLFVEAYASARFSPDASGADDEGSSDSVPVEITRGGPILSTGDGQTRSYRLPAKTIALTFDDGPDPWWTPRIQRVLDRYDVDATFFVVGSQVARHPDLVRRLVASGHEVGAHTFTHPRLSTLAGWRRRAEYSQTQLAIARAAGVRTSLLRFPYSSRPEAIDDAQWELVREAGRLGYLVVVNDRDSNDWARPGVDAIVRDATPPGDSGAVVLMHDAGGDRAQTVAALERLIPQLLARGYRFTTVSGGLNQALAHRALAQNPPASSADRWRGTALVWAVGIADGVLAGITIVFVVVGALAVGRTLLLLVLAGRHARRRRSPEWSWGPPVTEPVSIIVPAYNEKEGIAATVRSLAAGDHPDIEVIVVDDGSTDGTAEIVEALGLPNVDVIRKPNGGKASALNAGIEAARHELIVMVDADTVLEPDTVRRLVQPFADPSVGAVAGNVKVGNRHSLLARWQHIEYVIGFNLDRRLYETLRCMPTVPGAGGAFRRRALISATAHTPDGGRAHLAPGSGGAPIDGACQVMSDDTLAEDTDITMALLRGGWQVVYEEGARAWTEAPVTLAELWKQRYRWSYGTMQAMWKHRRALVEKGPFGRFGLPFLALFGVALPLLAPVIDLLAVYGLLFLGQTQTVIAWTGMLALQVVTAAVAFRLDRENHRPLWVLPLQQLAYRQLMYLVLIQSIVTALTGARLRWQKMQRTGQAEVHSNA
ncbi:glycosyltransferase [Phytohabitans sp. ZYX-F-186]|uniref:Glycosyltransferase n=1 Tax=Phytohabitans maris TaxID=3071409 RepID=A0ABU0ZV82_9ACTN|nr:glycosyltransferase [Phytohabitans sp. ZYX-F-186]MDQ7910948.1 glycosyltransferase [Phytohabitans sp. ZYX-F-186]